MQDPMGSPAHQGHRASQASPVQAASPVKSGLPDPPDQTATLAPPGRSGSPGRQGRLGHPATPVTKAHPAFRGCRGLLDSRGGRGLRGLQDRMGSKGQLGRPDSWGLAATLGQLDPMDSPDLTVGRPQAASKRCFFSKFIASKQNISKRLYIDSYADCKEFMLIIMSAK